MTDADKIFHTLSWRCLGCSHLNLPSTENCENCGGINPNSPEAQSAEPYWYCGNCYIGNPNERSNCRACHTIRPGFSNIIIT